MPAHSKFAQNPQMPASSVDGQSVWEKVLLQNSYVRDLEKELRDLQQHHHLLKLQYTEMCKSMGVTLMADSVRLESGGVELPPQPPLVGMPVSGLPQHSQPVSEDPENRENERCFLAESGDILESDPERETEGTENIDITEKLTAPITGLKTDLKYANEKLADSENLKQLVLQPVELDVSKHRDLATRNGLMREILRVTRRGLKQVITAMITNEGDPNITRLVRDTLAKSDMFAEVDEGLDTDILDESAEIRQLKSENMELEKTLKHILQQNESRLEVEVENKRLALRVEQLEQQLQQQRLSMLPSIQPEGPCSGEEPVSDAESGFTSDCGALPPIEELECEQCETIFKSFERADYEEHIKKCIDTNLIDQYDLSTSSNYIVWCRGKGV